MLGFDTGLHKEIEDAFVNTTRRELEIGNNLVRLSEKIRKVMGKDIEIATDKAEMLKHAHFVHLRIMGHFAAATLLFSKGFNIDGLTLVRSSLEELWLIQNFHLNPGYYKRWVKGTSIAPRKLREAPALSEKLDFNQTVYGGLSDISHARVTSIAHMQLFHPAFNRDMNRLRMDYVLLVLALFNYLYELVCLYETEVALAEHKEELGAIRKEIIDILPDIVPMGDIAAKAIEETKGTTT